MIQPESVAYFRLYAFSSGDTATHKSLDTLASEFFGREYKSQQVGDSEHDMWANDEVYLVRVETSDDVEELLDTYGENAQGEWVQIDSVQQWLDRQPSYPAYQDGWEPERKHDIELMRAAPSADVVVAHLVKNDVLPYGVYLIEVSW